MYPDYLMHYGIKGQKWGVRRYQKLEGGRTEEGKKRYRRISKDPSTKKIFKKAQAEVIKRLSNKPKPFKVKPIDLEAVIKRCGISGKEALKRNKEAKDIFDRAVRIEPGITKDVISAVKASCGKMYGLENRLKQPESIAAKLGAGKSINDAIRYTSVTDDEHYYQAYRTTRDILESKGYTETRCKNYFRAFREKKAKHKQVTCNYADRNGNQFEIQYQTVASQAAKELKTPIYEERRQAGLTEERKAKLESKMVRLAKHVPNPSNVFRIKSHG